MQENRVKRIMREGGLAIGATSSCLREAAVVEIIGLAGFDSVFIDLEHTALDLGDVELQVLAAERVGITPVVRPSTLDPSLILRLLDMGAQGIQVPHVTTAADARAAVQAVRYPPLGSRGLGGASRATNYGKTSLANHVEQSNNEILLAVMIEDLEGVENIDAIAATEGVDLISVGPTDLAKAMGVLGQPDSPELVAAIGRIAEAVKRNGNARLAIPMGHALFLRTASQLRALGVGYSVCGPAPQVRLLQSMSQQVEEIRGHRG